MTKTKKILMYLGLLLAICTPLSATLPDLGSDFRAQLPVNDEKLVGDMELRQIRAMGLMHQDPLINEYMAHTCHKLAIYMDLPYKGMHVKCFMINDNSINAFSFLGGHVGIHTGLLMITENENELAGVMAHEMAHISQQHILRMISDSKNQMPITIAESLAAIAVGLPELILPAIAGHAQHMLNYSRQYEQEADRIGMQLLSKANFDPQGLPIILERMAAVHKLDNRPPEYLLTHPLHESRVSDLRNRAGDYKSKQTASSNMFYLIKARVEVQSAKDLRQLIADYEHKLETGRYANKLAIQYSYAYALLLNDKAAKAWDVFKPIADAYPDDLIVQITAIEIEGENNQAQQAKARNERLLKLYPDCSSAMLEYANLLINMKQNIAAKKILNKYKKIHATEPLFYDLVRKNEGMLGNQVAVFEANAEWFLLHGDFGSSLAQLQSAIQFKNNDAKTTARLETRTKEIQEMLQKVKNI